MSLTGSLEDVTVADVLQFIHFGGRSGTLLLSSGNNRGEIGFHRGRIIFARSPNTKRLGELLVEREAITRHDLDGALRVQKRTNCTSALGQILVEMGVLTPERMKDVFERSVEEAVYDLVSWTRGSFEFAVDELKPIDDVSLSPGDILPDIHINTQMVLLEATRIVDERGRFTSGQYPVMDALPEIEGPTRSLPVIIEPPRPLLASVSLSSVQAQTNTAAESSENAAIRLRVQVVSTDRELIEGIEQRLLNQDAFVVQVSARDAGSRFPGEDPPVVLVDLREGCADVQVLGTIRRTRPGAALIALVERHDDLEAELYAAGAVAVVPAKVSIIHACLQNVQRIRSSVGDAQQSHAQLKEGAAKLRRVFGEFRSGLISATISLNLLNLVSESVDRAVLFVAAKTDLLVLGAFGKGPKGEPLARRTQGFRMKLEGAGALTDSLRDARAQTLSYDEARLPEELTALIGRPCTGQCAIFPLLGSRKVIATMYADNGAKNRPIDDVDFLDMATSQVGMFYENELLRRERSRVAVAPEVAGVG
ncbi:MAG TPA: DUF4388 domain-containing protein [Polyangiaceae bacterium]